MKKAIAILLTLVLSFTFSFAFGGTVSAEQSGDYTYTISGTTATITKYNGAEGDVTIPSQLDGYTVTGVGGFVNCSSLTSVTIPEGVTTISTQAFLNCINLTSVTLPTSIAAINTGAFYNCSKLCDITIPANVITINNCAFYGCAKLAGVVIPSGVSSIGEYAFYGCTSLTSVRMENGVSSIGMGAFKECTSLTDLTIPDSVTGVGTGAFNGCKSLVSVTIPDKVTGISSELFQGCSSLKSVTIPDDVFLFGIRVFANCPNLTEINVGSNNQYFTSLDGIVYSKDMTTLISYPGGKAGNYSIPTSVTRIERSAFQGCEALTGVTIPNKVTSIDIEVFSGCTGLVSVNMPSSISSIERNAFTNCSSLTSVIIPSGVTTIRSQTFQNCTALKNITIPASVTHIEDMAFYGCANLSYATFSGNAPVLDLHRNYLDFVSNPDPLKDTMCVFRDCAPGFHVIYKEGATGFTNPWNGYQTSMLLSNYRSEYDFNQDGILDLKDVTTLSRIVAGWPGFENPDPERGLDLLYVTFLSRYLSGWSVAVPTPPPPAGVNFKPGEVLVAIKEAYTSSGKIYTVDDFADVGAVSLSITSPGSTLYKIVLQDKTQSAVMNAVSILQERADVKYAEPNYIVQLIM